LSFKLPICEGCDCKSIWNDLETSTLAHIPDLEASSAELTRRLIELELADRLDPAADAFERSRRDQTQAHVLDFTVSSFGKLVGLTTDLEATFSAASAIDCEEQKSADPTQLCPRLSAIMPALDAIGQRLILDTDPS